MADRSIGTVKWFNNARGYGFITCGESDSAPGGSDPGGGTCDSKGDIFVHYRSIRGDGYRSLSEGQKVEFALQKGEKGLQAEDVACI